MRDRGHLPPSMKEGETFFGQNLNSVNSVCIVVTCNRKNEESVHKWNMKNYPGKTMKPKRTTLLTAFFAEESEHKRKHIEMMENQSFRLARQQKFNYGTRQAAKVVWGKDHLKLEIFRYGRRLSNYRLIGKTGRRWLYGRNCIRPGSPIRAMSITNRFRMRFGGTQYRVRRVCNRRHDRPWHI